MLKIWIFKICKLNVFMAFRIERKFHLVIFLRFRNHGTHKCTSKLSKREVKLVLENFDNFMVPTIWIVCIGIPLFLTKHLHEEKLHDLNIILSIYNTSMRRVVVSVEQFEVSTFCVKKCFFSKMQIHKNHNSLKKYHSTKLFFQNFPKNHRFYQKWRKSTKIP